MNPSPLEEATVSLLFPELQEIATNVTVQRARTNLSQAALAKKTGLSRGVISDIERAASADPAFSTLLRIANGLGITLAELCTFGHDVCVDDDELERRSHANDSEFVDARALCKAIAERDRPAPKRFSNAGRPRVTAKGIVRKSLQQ